MANLLATKPLNLLMEEARETGEHSLKRTLGVFQLTALGVGAIIGAGIFCWWGSLCHSFCPAWGAHLQVSAMPSSRP
jgi:APA family basic amino acid/polyamine antiporter